MKEMFNNIHKSENKKWAGLAGFFAEIEKLILKFI